jgi:magnesium chelatase subunit D
MLCRMSAAATMWSDAVAAAALFSVDPRGAGGICVRAGAGPVRDYWLQSLRSLFPPAVSFRKIPPAISDGRLLGGIDLAATLQAGRPIVERGLLAEIDGGILIAIMAERLSASTAAHLNAALDSHEVVIERDGVSQRSPSSFSVVALDEGLDDERAPASLCDRLAFRADFGSLSWSDIADFTFEADAIAAARLRLQQVTIGSEVIEALCEAATSLGIVSLRAPSLAAHAARAAAALEESAEVQREHVQLAARLVLAPRAAALPMPSEPETKQSADQEPGEVESEHREDTPHDDVVLEAALAAIPPDLLKRLQDGALRGPRNASVGRQGMSKTGPRRGRPIGARRGELGSGARLNVLETLRTAAPWQKLRRQAVQEVSGERTRFLIHKDDFRIMRFKERSSTSTIFVVDASGSSALQRLAEVKGAVELLLADCYVRRDEVALIAFRGKTAELILPPTRSLTRAKRSLAALAGGGGTPLSGAIISATTLALGVRGKGHSPTIVLMTDGRANICRDGSAGRAAAESEAQDAARQLRATGVPAVVIDTSPRPQPQAEKLAVEMGARYVALPYADASRLSQAVQSNMRAV